MQSFNLIEEDTEIHAVGRARDREGRTQLVHLVFTPTDKGYAQRSDTPGYNRDYVSHETHHALGEWMRCDFERTWWFQNAYDATEFMSRSRGTPDDPGRLPSFFGAVTAA